MNKLYLLSALALLAQGAYVGTNDGDCVDASAVDPLDLVIEEVEEDLPELATADLAEKYIATTVAYTVTLLDDGTFETGDGVFICDVGYIYNGVFSFTDDSESTDATTVDIDTWYGVRDEEDKNMACGFTELADLDAADSSLLFDVGDEVITCSDPGTYKSKVLVCDDDDTADDFYCGYYNQITWTAAATEDASFWFASTNAIANAASAFAVVAVAGLLL